MLWACVPVNLMLRTSVIYIKYDPTVLQARCAAAAMLSSRLPLLASPAHARWISRGPAWSKVGSGAFCTAHVESPLPPPPLLLPPLPALRGCNSLPCCLHSCFITKPAV